VGGYLRLGKDRSMIWRHLALAVVVLDGVDHQKFQSYETGGSAGANATLPGPATVRRS